MQLTSWKRVRSNKPIQISITLACHALAMGDCLVASLHRKCMVAGQGAGSSVLRGKFMCQMCAATMHVHVPI